MQRRTNVMLSNAEMKRNGRWSNYHALWMITGGIIEAIREIEEVLLEMEVGLNEFDEKMGEEMRKNLVKKDEKIDPIAR